MRATSRLIRTFGLRVEQAFKYGQQLDPDLFNLIKEGR